MGTSVRILLVAALPYIRLRAWRLLVQEPGVHLLDRVADATRGVAQIRALHPDLVLCDAAVAGDPAFAALFIRQPGETVQPPPLVLLAAEPLPPGARYQVPIAAVLPLDLPSWEMATYLSTLVDGHDLSSVSPPTNQNRSTSAPFIRASAAPAGGSAVSQVSSRPRENTRTQHGQRWSPTTRGAVDRRAVHDQPLIKTDGQAASLQQLDPLTGLADRSMLEHAARVLAELAYPATLIVLDLTYAPGSVVPANTTAHNAVVRWAASSLRVALRRDDLLSRVDGMVFAVLLPGLDHRLGEVIARRLLGVINTLDLSRYAYGAHLQGAISVSYWDQGLPVPAIHSLVAQTRESASLSPTVLTPIADPKPRLLPHRRIDLSGGIPHGEQPMPPG